MDLIEDNIGKILIVDDTIVNTRLLEKILVRNHYQVFPFNSPLVALNALSEILPDLILLDVVMPEMDGYEFCKKIKSISEYAAIPIIFLTSLSDTDSVIKGFEKGGSDYILKPFQIPELLARIRTHVQLKKSKDIISSLNDYLSKKNSEYEKDLFMAKKVQESLLPNKNLKVKHLSVGFSYIPMESVGGDFVDVYYSKEQNFVGFFICDVSGHGVLAALFSSMVKISLNHWEEYIDSPSGLLDFLRKSLSKNLNNMFLTAFACTVDLNTFDLKYSSAGHPEMYLLRGQEIISLQTSGPIILDLLKNNFEEKSFQLEHLDKLILLTDGITELTNPESIELGEENFKDIIRKTNSPPTEMCKFVINELDAFRNNMTQLDDITFLIAEFNKDS